MRLSHWRNRRGAVLVFVAVGSFIFLGMTGLALDGGMAYLTRAKLSRAVDAASLSAARSLRQGEDSARASAVAVALANGVTLPGANVVFGTNAAGQKTVFVRAERTLSLTFSRVFGQNEMLVAAQAETVCPPIDLVLVVDRSGSMAREGAWDDLQAAVRNFVDMFDNNIDQMGLVSFQIRANDDVTLRHNFKNTIKSTITSMNSAGDTNTGEGLRFARNQFQAGNVRPGAAKVVVFFTDGRPTAFRSGPPGGPATGNPHLGADRVIAVSVYETDRGRGYWDNPQSLAMDLQHNNPTGCSPNWTGNTTCTPPNASQGWTRTQVRNMSKTAGLNAARAIRENKVFVYTLALGELNPNDATSADQVPDPAYLRQLSNEEHNDNPTHPAGRSYVAPTAADLNNAFQTLAKDLLIRFTR